MARNTTNTTTKPRVSSAQLKQFQQQFIRFAEAGLFQPREMVDLLQGMNNGLVDRFEAVNMWLSISLEQVADNLMDAIASARIQDEDYPEEVYA